MWERFIEKKHTIDRLRSSPFAEHLDGFAAAMFASGYSRSSGTRYVNAAAHLATGAETRHAPVAQIDDRTVRRFAEHIGRRCRCPDSTRNRVRETRSGAAAFSRVPSRARPCLGRRDRGAAGCRQGVLRVDASASRCCGVDLGDLCAARYGVPPTRGVRLPSSCRWASGRSPTTA
jgi:hypothetical protein